LDTNLFYYYLRFLRIFLAKNPGKVFRRKPEIMKKAKKFPSKAGIFFSEKFPLFRLPVIIISAGNILAYNMTLQISGILKFFFLQQYRRPISPFNPFFLFNILLM